MSINRQYLSLNGHKLDQIETMLRVKRRNSPVKTFHLDSLEKRVVPLPQYESLGDRNLRSHFTKRGIMQNMMKTGVVDESGELKSLKKGPRRRGNEVVDHSLELSSRRSNVIMVPEQNLQSMSTMELQTFYQNQFIRD